MSPGASPVFTSLCALRGVQTDMFIFSKHLANEVARRGVRINRVTRAGVLAERMECQMPEGGKRQAAASGPPGRIGQRRPCRRRCTLYRRRRARIIGVTLDVTGGKSIP
jgi:3-oxoacyl-[acyl-carrier protein] reductase